MEYRRSIFTFLDFLGFGELVKEEKSANVIDGILGTLRYETTPAAFAEKHLEISSLSFSDSTVRAVPIESGSKPTPLANGILYYELMTLILAQSYLSCRHGRFLRGALTIGDIYLRGATVFGPALVHAYKLESECAVYPRIIIDPIVF